MKKRNLLPALAVVLAVTTPPSLATSPTSGRILTDPAGDVRLIGPCSPISVPCDVVDEVLAAEPSVDIVAADIETNARYLDFTISLVDLPDKGVYEQYRF